MRDVLEYTLQSDGASARLLVTGTLTAAGALHLLHVCRKLPPEVRALRVDLSRLRPAEPSAVDAFAHLVRRSRRGWRVEFGPAPTPRT